VELFASTKRRLTLTAAGLALRPYAEQALATARDGADAVRAHRTLRGGVASFGLPRNAELYALTDLAAEMHARHPLVGMRLIGQNSAEVADAIRAGVLEAGLVVLPVDDDGLDVEPVIRDEVLYATADPARAAAPVTTEALRDAQLVLYDAHYGNHDPTRRQLNDRLQQLGGRLEPHIEVEYLAGALRLAAMGVGDTIVARAAVDGGLLPEGLLTTPFAEPLYDTLAVAKQRHLPLSPATRELRSIALERLAAFDRRRNRTARPG
jgi:DNA-binding transcriptional LysR family regulator